LVITTCKLVGDENFYPEMEELCFSEKLELRRLHMRLKSDTATTLGVFVSAKYLSSMQMYPAQSLNVSFRGPFEYYCPCESTSPKPFPFLYLNPKLITWHLVLSRIVFLLHFF